MYLILKKIKEMISNIETGRFNEKLMFMLNEKNDLSIHKYLRFTNSSVFSNNVGECN